MNSISLEELRVYAIGNLASINEIVWVFFNVLFFGGKEDTIDSVNLIRFKSLFSNKLKMMELYACI